MLQSGCLWCCFMQSGKWNIIIIDKGVIFVWKEAEGIESTFSSINLLNELSVK